MEQTNDGTGTTERISAEQLQKLDLDEKSGMLFYLTGFLEKSQEFQDALTRAYDAQIRSRARMASRG